MTRHAYRMFLLAVARVALTISREIRERITTRIIAYIERTQRQ